MKRLNKKQRAHARYRAKRMLRSRKAWNEYWERYQRATLNTLLMKPGYGFRSPRAVARRARKPLIDVIADNIGVLAVDEINNPSGTPVTRGGVTTYETP